jgi:hypothetical protein
MGAPAQKSSCGAAVPSGTTCSATASWTNFTSSSARSFLGKGTRIFDNKASIRRIETRSFDGSDNALLRYEVRKDST